MGFAIKEGCYICSMIKHLKWTAPLALLLMASSCSNPEEYDVSVPSSVQALTQLKADVTYLASDELQGRATGTEGERMAAAYVASRFEVLGLTPKGDSSWFQSYDFKPHPPVQMHGSGDSLSMGMALVQEVHGTNVAAFLDNGAAKTIVIGAHHDHLGLGDENSLFRSDSTEVHNGADDNASGVGALLLLAERLSLRKSNHNFLFLSFSGEEKGLWGSKSWIKSPTIPLDNILCMLNMDMVGRLKAERVVAVYGNGTSPVWTPILESIATDSLDLTFNESGIGPSDHTSFYLENLPVLHFFTGQHEDYHKPTDDVEHINWEGIVAVANLMDSVLVNLDQHAELEFTKTKDEDNESTPNFQVTLGVIPDYLFQEKGMRIDGTSEERPASNAGLQRGDIVIMMGDSAVKDMQDYMKCLGIFEPGQTTPVTVLRDGEELTVDVTWD